MSRRQSIKRAALASIIFLSTGAAYASNWIGASANWSSNANPGWNATGVPDAIGAIANHAVNTTGTTTQDKNGGVIVGTISVSHTAANLWTISNASGKGIIVNQDGAGSGAGLFTNTGTGADTSNALFITGTGTITLQDDLNIVNGTSVSTNVNGSIQIDNIIAGTGNITLTGSGAGTTGTGLTATATSSFNATRFSKANTYTGNTLIKNGLVVLNTSATPFGISSNLVTLGDTGSGNAALLTRDATSFINYALTVAPSASGETRILGSVVSNAAASPYTVSTGTVALNGDLTLRAGGAATSTHIYSGNWTGTGALTKVGASIASLTGTNTNSGKITVSAGTLHFGKQVSLFNNGASATWNDTNIQISSGGTLALSIGGAGEFTNADVQTISALGSGTGGFGNGSFLALDTTSGSTTISAAIANANTMGLAKSGTNTLTLTGANTYTGGTVVLGGTLQLGVTGAFGATTNSLTTSASTVTDVNGLSLSVGTLVGTGGTIGNNLAATSANLSIGNGNANSTTAYSGVIADNTGAGGTLSLSKVGTGTLVLSGTNTYTGGTTINAGVLRFNSNAAVGGTGANVTVNSGAVLSAGFAIDQTFVNRVVGSSAGVIALNVNSTNALDFSASGANLANASLGATGSFTYSGTLTPNASTYRLGGGGGTLTVSSALTGVNSLVVGLNGTNLGKVILTGANTYSGTTTINSGIGQFANQLSLYNNVTANWTDTNITVQSGATAQFNVGGTGEFTTSDIAIISGLGTATGGFQSGSVIGLDTTNAAGGVFAHTNAINNTNAGANVLSLTKYGTNTLLLSGTNTYTGTTLVTAGTLQFAKQVSLYNNTTAAPWDSAHLTVNSGTTAAFNVGGTGEFTSTDVTALTSIGTATNGFVSGSTFGFDTTNASGGEFVYGDVIINPNAGANILSISKIGLNTLTLSGSNTYTGQTIVNGGTLKVTGTHTILTTLPPEAKYTVGSIAGTSGNIIFDGATINSNYGMFIGENGIGTGTLESGTINLNVDNTGANQFFGVGRNAGSNGTFTMNNGSITVGNDWFVTAVSGTGTAVMNNGTINAVVLEVAQETGSVGNFTLNDGVINAPYAYVGYRGTANGTLTVNGGTANFTNRLVTGVVASAASVGKVVQHGGTINAGYVTIGEASTTHTGTHIMDGGVLNSTSTLVYGYQGTATGTISNSSDVNLGNQLWIGVFGTGTLNFTGGTIDSNTFCTLGETTTGVGTLNMSTATGSATLRLGAELVLGYQGKGNVNQTNGSIIVGTAVNLGQTSTAEGTYVMDGGSLVSANWVRVGWAGKGTFTQNGGFIAAGVAASGSKAFGVGVNSTGNGTFTMNHGELLVVNDWLVSGVSGKGVASILNDSVVTANTLAAGQNSGSNGTITINTTGTVTITSMDFASLPTIVPTPLTGIFEAAVNAGSTGTINLINGTVTMGDWAYIGRSGNGTFNMTGGSMSVGDNFSVGLNSGSVGLMTMTTGTITVVGNDPSYTGNFLVARSGTGTLNISGGLVDMVVGATSTNTNNSVSYSFINNVGGVGHELDLTQDGNLKIGEQAGTGVLNLSGTGKINVSANVLLGGFNVTSLVGGKGTLTMSGNSEIHVGLNSPTGGDMILGSAITTSQATVNLQGGLLDVSHSVTDGVNTYGGMIAAGGPSTPGAFVFNFTGGTLKVRDWNSSLAGGNLGDLTQNGAGSLLDVTGNNTTLHSGYALGAGNATVGAGRTLTIEGGMTDLAGTGVVSVNAGGALVSNNVRTDTLNLTSGTATINANGGTAGASKVETLNTTGTSKLNLKDNDLVVGTGTVAAVRAQIKTGVAGAAGITSDLPAFGVSTGFGYALGNDSAISPLLAGSLTGQSYDADSVLVKYTFLGDADLDGDSDLNDLGLWAQSFTGDLGNPVTPVTFWTSGDFDYDGDTDLNDLGFWASTFTGDLGGGVGSLIVVAPNAPASAVAALNSMGITVVPEPSTFVLAGVGLAGLAIKVRRRKFLKYQ